MKTFNELIISESNAIDVQEDSINRISTSDLKKYLEVANKFLSAESKTVIGWLISNPDYVDILARKDSDNALASFINRGMPKEEELRPIYRAVKAVIKKGRALEIPVFLTKAQFDAVINKKSSLDEIVLDLESEAGRTDVAKKYDPLVWKIARQFENKSSFTIDDLYSIGLSGLVHAMNTYGKKGSKSKKDEESIKGYTFLSYAGFMIRSAILEEIKNQSHMVRIPVSVQAKDRKDLGKNVKTNNISIDTPISKDKDGNTKTIGDKIGDYERGGKSLDDEDIDNMWKGIKVSLDNTFSEDDLGVFYSHFGLFGHKKLSGKEIMAKYGFKNQSNINAVTNKIIKHIRKTPRLWNMFVNMRDLIAECQHDNDLENRDFEPVHIAKSRMCDYLDDDE